jgi:hypothetical protein
LRISACSFSLSPILQLTWMPTSSNSPVFYDPNRQKAHDFSRGMNAVIITFILFDFHTM